MWLNLCVVFTDSAEKYDSRDVDRLEKDDNLVEGYLTWRIYVVDDALKMIDDSFQWRKEFGVNGKKSYWMIETVTRQAEHPQTNSTYWKFCFF